MRCDVVRVKVLRFSLLLVTAGLFSGCGGGQGRDLPLNQETARTSFQTFLETWKKGEKPDVLKQHSPQIIVGDFAWESGHQLLSYEIRPEESSDGSNLRKSVDMKLKDKSGSESQETVEYIIGTSPVITIFRP